MLWVLKRTLSMNLFFIAPKHKLKLMGKKILIFLRSNKCLSKPMHVAIEKEFMAGYTTQNELKYLILIYMSLL